MYLVLYTDMDIEHQEQTYMKYLIDDLEEYAQSDYYPFHMPGHKRKSLSFPNPYEIDITEIDGFDNLHHATGMIKEAEVRGAELYHSKRRWLVTPFALSASRTSFIVAPPSYRLKASKTNGAVSGSI